MPLDPSLLDRENPSTSAVDRLRGGRKRFRPWSNVDLSELDSALEADRVPSSPGAGLAQEAAVKTPGGRKHLASERLPDKQPIELINDPKDRQQTVSKRTAKQPDVDDALSLEQVTNRQRTDSKQTAKQPVADERPDSKQIPNERQTASKQTAKQPTADTISDGKQLANGRQTASKQTAARAAIRVSLPPEQLANRQQTANKQTAEQQPVDTTLSSEQLANGQQTDSKQIAKRPIVEDASALELSTEAEQTAKERETKRSVVDDASFSKRVANGHHSVSKQTAGRPAVDDTLSCERIKTGQQTVTERAVKDPAVDSELYPKQIANGRPTDSKRTAGRSTANDALPLKQIANGQQENGKQASERLAAYNISFSERLANGRQTDSKQTENQSVDGEALSSGQTTSGQQAPSEQSVSSSATPSTDGEKVAEQKIASAISQILQSGPNEDEERKKRKKDEEEAGTVYWEPLTSEKPTQGKEFQTTAKRPVLAIDHKQPTGPADDTSRQIVGAESHSATIPPSEQRGVVVSPPHSRTRALYDVPHLNRQSGPTPTSSVNTRIQTHVHENSPALTQFPGGSTPLETESVVPRKQPHPSTHGRPGFVSTESTAYANYSSSDVSKTAIKQVPNRQQTNSEYIANGQQTGIDRITNRQRTDSEQAANGQQTSSRQIADGLQTDSERTAQEVANGQQTASTLTVCMLSGLQLRLVLYFADLCKLARTAHTPPMSIDTIANVLDSSKGTAKSVVYRLTEKRFISVYASKTGRGGWSQYVLPEDLYREALALIRTPQTLQVAETDSKQVAQRVATPLSSSSRSLDLTTSTAVLNSSGDKQLAEQFSRALASLSFDLLGASDAMQLWRTGKFETPADVIESMEHMAFYIKSGLAKDINSPKGFAMRELRRGYFGRPAGFVSAEEQAEAAKATAAEAKAKNLRAIRLRRCESEFDCWYEELSQDERADLLNKAGQGGSFVNAMIARTSLRKEYGLRFGIPEFVPSED